MTTTQQHNNDVTTTSISIACPSEAALMFAMRETMQRAFGFTPFAWQDDLLWHLLKMASPRHSITPASSFLCQPTGGGKLLVRDVFASGWGGVTWCIGPLLALGVDQEFRSTNEAFSTMGRLLPSI
jgi:superfamily II DNA helicase RecQ